VWITICFYRNQHPINRDSRRNWRNITEISQTITEPNKNHNTRIKSPQQQNLNTKSNTHTQYTRTPAHTVTKTKGKNRKEEKEDEDQRQRREKRFFFSSNFFASDPDLWWGFWNFNAWIRVQRGLESVLD
jgi:hypothetical protein